MTYIPKNKIQTNLYTTGGEYEYVSNQENYIGYYYKLYNGKTYAGRTPNEFNPQELVATPFKTHDKENTLYSFQDT